MIPAFKSSATEGGGTTPDSSPEKGPSLQLRSDRQKVEYLATVWLFQGGPSSESCIILAKVLHLFPTFIWGLSTHYWCCTVRPLIPSNRAFEKLFWVVSRPAGVCLFVSIRYAPLHLLILAKCYAVHINTSSL